VSPPLIGVVGFVVLFCLLAVGMPIAFAMATIAFAGLVVVGGFTGSLNQLSLTPYSSVASYTMSTIPLFVLMGGLAFTSGLSSDAYRTAYKWIGSWPGGLAMATIGGCAGFAACTGSSVASIGMMTSTALPEMQRYNYDPKLATGCIASGTTLGILIPPSIPFIIYALFASESVGQLFIAGIFPGLLLTGLFMLTIYIMVKWNPSMGPSGPKTTWREKFGALKSTWAMIILVMFVLGGIWGGIFSPIEAGGMGAFGALLIALVRRRLTMPNFIDSLKSVCKTTAMIFAILIGAMMFNYFLALTRLPFLLAHYVAALAVPPIVIIIVMMCFYLIAGCLMDTLGMMVLTLPIFIPIVKSIGVDLVLFGVLTTIMTEMALITPPIGMNVFVLGGMSGDIPLYTIFRGIAPFLIAMIIGLALIIAFPQIALFLPSTMIR
jgi:C4-dicarboxylate transporter DctM subunit